MNLVPSLSMRKPGIFLLLPLVLLLLQLGLALLHHHHDSSWYDHKDPIHQCCSDPSIVSNRAAKLKVRQVTPAALEAPIAIFLAKNLALATSPEAAIINKKRLKSCMLPCFRPSVSFARRAPPA
jgi:hypothetical protein